MSMCVAAFFGSVHFCFVCLLVVKDQHVLFFVFSYFCPYVVIRSSVIFFCFSLDHLKGLNFVRTELMLVFFVVQDK